MWCCEEESEEEEENGDDDDDTWAKRLTLCILLLGRELPEQVEERLPALLAAVERLERQRPLVKALHLLTPTIPVILPVPIKTGLAGDRGHSAGMRGPIGWEGEDFIPNMVNGPYRGLYTAPSHSGLCMQHQVIVSHSPWR
jgi:hypothetical protein